MKSITNIKCTHYKKDSAGNNIVCSYDLVDDGTYITKPPAHPFGGARVIIAETGDMQAAISKARRSEFALVVGGCGYSSIPIKIEIN